MKYLVDTCGWIEWLTEGKLIKEFAPYLKNPTELVVPTLIQYELYKWVCREKNSDIALEIIGITENSHVVTLDTNLSLYAADMSKHYNLAMTDAIIYATSRTKDVLLITSDKHFENLPHVKLFSKASEPK